MSGEPIDFTSDLRMALLAVGSTVVQLDQDQADHLAPRVNHPLFLIGVVGTNMLMPLGSTGVQTAVLSMEQLAWLQAEISAVVGKLPEDQQQRYYATVPGAIDHVKANSGRV